MVTIHNLLFTINVVALGLDRQQQQGQLLVVGRQEAEGGVGAVQEGK